MAISLEHYVDFDFTLERSRQDIIIEGIANSSCRIMESEGAAEIAGLLGYPQLLLVLKPSWTKAPRGTSDTHLLTIEHRVYMVYDHMDNFFARRLFLGVPETNMNIWLAHGLLGCAALLLVFPFGVASLWFKKSRWSITHWKIQACGTMLLALTTGVGLLNNSRLHHKHQSLGLVVFGMVLIQMPLGFVNALDDTRGYRASVSFAHPILGFSTLVLGWLVILTGFRLASVATGSFVFVGLLSATEISALITGSFLVRWRRRIVSKSAPNATKHEELAMDVFTLAEPDPEDEYHDEDNQAAGP
jgi:hypothetical protein